MIPFVHPEASELAHSTSPPVDGVSIQEPVVLRYEEYQQEGNPASPRIFVLYWYVSLI